MELAPIFKKAYWSLAFFGLLYVLFIYSLTFPTIQKHAIYMHKVNPSKYYDLNDAEYFGFLRSQVQPFNIVTPDNETLYSWHILPLHLCDDYEDDILVNSAPGPAADVTQTKAFKLLAEHPTARVIVSLHGNAADVGTGYRPKIYRNLMTISTPSDPVHVIAFDYRGFGKSTGTPSEEGLITDAEAVINYLTSPPLSIPRSRIVITGVSLGTAVAAGVTERLAFGQNDAAVAKRSPPSEPFAGVFLFAPFRNTPDLLDSYSFLGKLPPILSPLVGYPRAQQYVLSHVVDRWDTASRLARLTGVASPNTDEKGAASQWANKDVDITIVHAVNDHDIPWREGKRTWEIATGGSQSSGLGTLVSDVASEDGKSEIKIWERTTKDGKGVKRVTWQRVKYGGHDAVATLPSASLAIKKAFERRAEKT